MTPEAHVIMAQRAMIGDVFGAFLLYGKEISSRHSKVSR